MPSIELVKIIHLWSVSPASLIIGKSFAFGCSGLFVQAFHSVSFCLLLIQLKYNSSNQLPLPIIGSKFPSNFQIMIIARVKYFSFCTLKPGGIFFKNHFGEEFLFTETKIEIKKDKTYKIE